MVQIKKMFLSALMLTAMTAVAQNTETKSEAQKVKDSVKMDVRHMGKVTTTTTTTTKRVGYRKKKRDESAIKPVNDSLVVQETAIKKDSALRQEDMPIIEADKANKQ